jgi:hypothetical protein
MIWVRSNVMLLLSMLLLQVDLDLSQCLWMLGVVGVLVPITWLGTPNDFW